MSEFRYINNTASDITYGSDTVPAYGDLVVAARVAGFEDRIGTTLELLIDGVVITPAPGNSATKLLFVIRSANMALTTDQYMTKVFTGTSYIPTMVVAKRVTGGATVACVGGIYDTAAKAGIALIPNTSDFVTLAATVPVLITGTGVNTVLPTTANAILSLTTGSTAACLADVFVYGAILD